MKDYEHASNVLKFCENQLALYKKRQGPTSRKENGPLPLVVATKDGILIEDKYPLRVIDIVDKENIAHVKFDYHPTALIELKAIFEPISINDILTIGHRLI